MNKDKKVTIFGYGSLMNEASLRETVPDAMNRVPATVGGYVRVFNTQSLFTFTESGEMYAVLNVEERAGAVLNGACFDVTQEYLTDLKKREEGYEMREVRVTSLIDGTEFDALIFVDVITNTQNFVFNDPMQMAYLERCADGAKNHGEEFYKKFLETTLVGGEKIGEIKGLLG